MNLIGFLTIGLSDTFLLDYLTDLNEIKFVQNYLQWDFEHSLLIITPMLCQLS